MNVDRGLDETATRQALRTYLGCRDTIWVPPLADEATGHVDVFLYVSGPGRVLVGRYRPWQDRENAVLLDETARLLEGRGFEVRRIPMPRNSRGTIFRSYTNVMVTDGAVFVPVYRADRRFEGKALRAVGDEFPRRRIVPVYADEPIELGGALHCIAMTVARP